MDDPLTPAHRAAEKRLRVKRRAKRGLIAGYKVPKTVELREEPLPLSGAMKVLKRELRAPHWQGRERAVH